jgi:integrase
MATPRFVLKDKKAENDTLIFLLYRFANDRLKYSTSLTISPAQWDDATQRPKLNDVPDKTRLQKLNVINNLLNDYVSKIAKIKEVWTYQKIELTPEILRAELDKEFKIEKAARPKITFLQFIEEYNNTPRFIHKSNPPRPLGPESFRKYKIVQQHLIDFANQKRNGVLDFSDIGQKLNDDFIGYLRETRNQSNNTSGKNVSVLGMFARAAYDAGFIKDETRVKQIKGFRENVFNIYLTEEELDTIYKHDFSKSPKLDRVRDYFIIGCRTALRYSDFTRIKKEHLYTSNGKELLKIRTQKTRQDVVVPVHWQVKAILEKYDFKLPRAISNQNSNEYLKTIGQQCEINEAVIKGNTKGGKYEEKVFEKWQLIGTHTARRTGASLMYKAEIKPGDIMKITGHTSEAALLKYIKLDKEEHAELMAKNAYFEKQDH